LTQADSVERCEGTTGVVKFVLIERGTWPLLSKPCTAIATAMDLIAEGEAQLLLGALVDRAPERRKPMPHSARNQAQAACVCGVPHRMPAGQASGLPATPDTIAGLWPHVEASALLSPATDSARGLHLFTTNHA
jgi:hypothetical protein